MKIKLFTLTLAAGALTAVMVSCGSNAGKEEGKECCDLELESYGFNVVSTTTDSVPSIMEGADKLRSIGEGVLPKAKAGSKLESLRDSLQKLAAVEFDAEGKAMPVLSNGFVADQEQNDSTEACSFRINKLSVSLITPRVAVWNDEAIFYPCGAAHPVSATTYVNYDRKQNRILALSDLMTAGYEEPLAKMLREKLKDMDVDLLVNIDSVGVPPVFNITRDGINFTYGLYSIAPYSSGEINVKFTAWELGDVLTDDAFVLIMGARF